MGGPIFRKSVQGVDDNSPPSGFGVRAVSDTEEGFGVIGLKGTTVRDRVERAGVHGESDKSSGVFGKSDDSYGVHGRSCCGHSGAPAVYGQSEDGPGVAGQSDTSYGVAGHSDTSYGLVASSNTALAALLEGRVDMTSDVYMYGPVSITGPLTKPGGSFKIDHPLDPANKYLSHSFVESPDMKNVYDGVVTLDDKGEADIELPDWFGALNKDFRYQLTAIGAPGPNLHISEEIPDGITSYSNSRSRNSNKNKNNNSSRFKVAGGTSGMKVSWQVTGIRKDPWANAHRIPVEEDKPAKERGYYLYAELYGQQPEERGMISRLLVPEIERKSCS
jgi:hypothetical protein